MSTSAATSVANRHRALLFQFFHVPAALILMTATVCAESLVFTPYVGITRITDSLTLPAPADQTPGSGLGTHTANINVIKIDLTAPGIGFKVSPGNGDSPGEALTRTTLQFLSQENAQLAVNLHFFDFTTNSAVNTTLTGFAASNGTVYSLFEAAPLANSLLPYALTADAPAINISATNNAQIVNVGATQGSLAGGVVPYNAFSGSDQVITNGVKTLPQIVTTVTGPHQIVEKTVPPFSGAPLGNWYTDQIAARTAIGLNEDNTIMFIFTVDAGGSAGMTVSEEVDYLLSNYPVYNLINLDGGGSTTLAMEDPLTRTDSIINSVSTPRFVGSSLAILAQPVPEPSSLAMLITVGLAAVVIKRRT
jgi:exopolysaccharide biosynthesis protein